MPLYRSIQSRPKTPKTKEKNWETFRRGLNTLLRETELQDDELSQAENIVLTGKGVPTKRWGSKLYNTAGATGATIGLSGYYKSDGTNELVSITNEGFLTIKSGASYTQRVGASWSSGSDIDITQLDDSLYIVSDTRELVRYSSPTLASFPTIAIPTGAFATQFSGASGAYIYSYRISAVSSVGETLASSNALATSCPQDLIYGQVRVSWTAVSAASGVLKGYNVYGRNEGDERFLAFVQEPTTQYDDDGTAIPQDFTFPPTADSTGGIKAKFIERFQDRLVYAGIDGEPSKVVISGRVPFHENNDISFGGNFIRIEPDAGDDVTGLKTFRDRIIVFKERSVWQVTLSQSQVGNFFVTIPDATLLSQSQGAIAAKSVVPVENDLFFLTRNGVYALGDEPNVLNVLRTNEISARIRPEFETFSTAQLADASAIYYDFKYILSFPGSSKSYVYDRERLAWTGPWTVDANMLNEYFDSSNEKHLLFGSTTEPKVLEFSEDFKDDQGTNFSTILKTKKEDFGDWTIFKLLRQIYFLFRKIRGTVNISIRVQDRDGNLKTIKSFSLTGQSVNNSGWASGQWGNFQWADSEESAEAADINEKYSFAELNSIIRNYQIIVETEDNSSYELLSIRSRAVPTSLGFIPLSEKV